MLRKKILPFQSFDNTLSDSNQVPYRDLKSLFEKHRVDVKNIFQGFLDEGFNYLIYFTNTERSVTNITEGRSITKPEHLEGFPKYVLSPEEISISLSKQCAKSDNKTDTNIMIADNLSESLNRLRELGFEIDSIQVDHRSSKITKGGKTIEIQVQLS